MLLYNSRSYLVDGKKLGYSKMASTTTKSYLAKPGEVKQDWFLVDATDRVLGRMAVQIATILMGKHKPCYTPHVDVGDFVVVTNAEKVALTGRKRQQKEYDYYTYYPGGRRATNLAALQAKKPEQIVELAVRRMLPKNKLARKMLSKLKVYSGPEHPHAAQGPKPLETRA